MKTVNWLEGVISESEARGLKLVYTGICSGNSYSITEQKRMLARAKSEQKKTGFKCYVVYSEFGVSLTVQAEPAYVDYINYNQALANLEYIQTKEDELLVKLKDLELKKEKSRELVNNFILTYGKRG